MGSHRRAKTSIQTQMAVLCMPSVGDPNRHNSQGKPGLLLESVGHSDAPSWFYSIGKKLP